MLQISKFAAEFPSSWVFLQLLLNTFKLCSENLRTLLQPGWGLSTTVWKVTVWAALVASVSSVGAQQVVKARQEHQDTNDQDGNGPTGVHSLDVTCQQEATGDNQRGANQKLRGGQSNGLVRGLARPVLAFEYARSQDTQASLKRKAFISLWSFLLKVNVFAVRTGDLGVFHFAARHRGSQAGPGGSHKPRSELGGLLLAAIRWVRLGGQNPPNGCPDHAEQLCRVTHASPLPTLLFLGHYSFLFSFWQDCYFNCQVATTLQIIWYCTGSIISVIRF